MSGFSENSIREFGRAGVCWSESWVGRTHQHHRRGWNSDAGCPEELKENSRFTGSALDRDAGLAC